MAGFWAAAWKYADSAERSAGLLLNKFTAISLFIDLFRLESTCLEEKPSCAETNLMNSLVSQAKINKWWLFNHLSHLSSKDTKHLLVPAFQIRQIDGDFLCFSQM